MRCEFCTLDARIIYVQNACTYVYGVLYAGTSTYKCVTYYANSNCRVDLCLWMELHPCDSGEYLRALFFGSSGWGPIVTFFDHLFVPGTVLTWIQTEAAQAMTDKYDFFIATLAAEITWRNHDSNDVRTSTYQVSPVFWASAFKTWLNYVVIICYVFHNVQLFVISVNQKKMCLFAQNSWNQLDASFRSTKLKPTLDWGRNWNQCDYYFINCNLDLSLRLGQEGIPGVDTLIYVLLLMLCLSYGNAIPFMTFNCHQCVSQIFI